jgi:hypothetical protein
MIPDGGVFEQALLSQGLLEGENAQLRYNDSARARAIHNTTGAEKNAQLMM